MNARARSPAREARALPRKTPSAGRMLWGYGPEKRDITILGVEAHPEDKKHGAYQRITLASMPGKKA